MNFDNTQPIWLQLHDEFARNIAVGIWPPGSRIPGVRDLASQMGVNPNTVQRSLAELERTGLCRSERTSGRFVTDDPRLIEKAQLTLATDAARDFIVKAKGLHMSSEQATNLITTQWKDTTTHE